jgi:lipid-A-disaccharide synthase-like uncharacterized protein
MLAATVSGEVWTPWLIVGFVGQFIFGLRFIVQWIATERAKRSVVPVAFWYLSLAGTVITLAYAIYRLDPVFIASFSLNMVIYGRNLYFIHRRPAVGEAAADRPPQEENHSSSSG